MFKLDDFLYTEFHKRQPTAYCLLLTVNVINQRRIPKHSESQL